MKLEKIVNSGIRVLCGMLLAIVVMLTFLQIILRQFFCFSLNWSDEISQFCMTWLVLIGAIGVTKNGQHLNAGLKLHQKLNERQICLIDGILALVIVSVTVVVTYQSAIFSFMAMRLESLSLSWVKMGYIFIALPFATLGMGYYCLKDFFKNFARIFKKD
jgi:TRAP-type C4-dicarboxylate transport system permease small subunit